MTALQPVAKLPPVVGRYTPAQDSWWVVKPLRASRAFWIGIFDYVWEWDGPWDMKATLLSEEAQDFERARKEYETGLHEASSWVNNRPVSPTLPGENLCLKPSKPNQ